MKQRLMMKTYIGRCLRGAGVLAVCVLIGFVLVLAAYAIPADAVRDGVEGSLETLISEGMRRYSLPGYEPSRLDNFTDAIMIGNTVLAPENTVLRNALLVHRLNSLDPAGALNSYMSGSWNEGTYPYSIYWHGYLIFLKLLLRVLSYDSIRYLLMAGQLMLVLAAAVQLEKRGLGRYAVALFGMYISLCPTALMNSLTYSSVFFIGMGTGVAILFAHEHLEKLGYGYVFLVVGALTSYVDFLTFPVFSLGIPLVIYTLLVSRNGRKVNLLYIFGLCVAWGIGYGGMWAAKWVLVTLLTEVNGIQAAFSEILYRTNNYLDNVGEVSFFAGASAALDLVFNPLNAMVLLLCAACGAGYLRRGVDRTAGTNIVALLLIALIPFAWMIFACNHTVSHVFFAYRCLGVTVFAALSALLRAARE